MLKEISVSRPIDDRITEITPDMLMLKVPVQFVTTLKYKVFEVPCSKKQLAGSTIVYSICVDKPVTSKEIIGNSTVWPSDSSNEIDVGKPT